MHNGFYQVGAKIPAPKFGIGDHVRVTHPREGVWRGRVLSRNLADDAWEYEVTNAPRGQERGAWRPLAWEHEMERLE